MTGESQGVEELTVLCHIAVTGERKGHSLFPGVQGVCSFEGIKGLGLLGACYFIGRHSKVEGEKQSAIIVLNFGNVDQLLVKMTIGS